MIDRYEFELLRFLEREGFGEYPIRALVCALSISGAALTKSLDGLKQKGLICAEGSSMGISPAGYEALEPYRVKKALILAAGFGSRMMPATKDCPKPMVSVNGTRIIDTQLDALAAAGVTDVTVVGGYRFEKLAELLEKYPSLRLVENREYAETNNISSVMLGLDCLRGGCYLCEADLLISDPRVITKYQYASNILGSWSLETDDWCFRMKDGFASEYQKGGTYCYNYYGISYWTTEDCDKLREDFPNVYGDPDGGRNYFWEFIPLVLKKDRYQVEIRPCSKRDIVEIDSYEELRQLDPGYACTKEKPVNQT